ncbi:MAG: hypothetical protein U0Q15_01520 [Kineosporiaceae bacterium]
MTRAVLKAHSALSAAILLVCLAFAGLLFRKVLLSVPLVDHAVPVRVLVMVGVSNVALSPLQAVVPSLQVSLPRARPWGTAVLIAVVVASLLSVAPAVVLGSLRPWPDVTLFLALLSLGIIGVTQLGELAWLLPTGAGLAALFFDAGPQHRVSAMLESTPPVLAVALLAAACLMYASRGPRRE